MNFWCQFLQKKDSRQKKSIDVSEFQEKAILKEWLNAKKSIDKDYIIESNIIYVWKNYERRTSGEISREFRQIVRKFFEMKRSFVVKPTKGVCAMGLKMVEHMEGKQWRMFGLPKYKENERVDCFEGEEKEILDRLWRFADSKEHVE
eukprot:UN18408